MAEVTGMTPARIETLLSEKADLSYADSKDWVKRVLTAREDLNKVTTPGAYTVTLSVAPTIANLPSSRPGSFEVLDGSTTGIVQRYSEDNDSPLPKVWTRVGHSNGTSWRPWVLLTPSPSWIANGTSLSTILIPGDYTAPSALVAGTIPDMPPEVAGQPFTLRVEGANTTLSAHRLNQTLITLPYAVGQPPREFKRSIHNSKVTADWIEFGIDAAKNSLKDNYTLGRGRRLEVLQQESRLRRGGVIGTNGRTPVALSFDHGLSNFKQYVLPHLIRLGLPCSLALNPANHGSGENGTVTWSELQSWALNHGVEMVHHGQDHGNVADGNPLLLQEKLLSSIPQMKTAMPEVVADAFVMPGASGNFYDGFDAALDPEKWWDHPAGRMILDNFPVVTSAVPGQAVPVVGSPTIGADRAGVDNTSWATVTENKVRSLYGTGTGMHVFNHPSKIENGITATRFTQFLEFLANERDAGRIEVLTISGFAWADPRQNYGFDLTAFSGWSGSTGTVTIDPMLTNLKGAQVALMGEATTSGSITVSAVSDAGGLNTSRTISITPGQPIYLPFSIPKTASVITITCPASVANRRTMPV